MQLSKKQKDKIKKRVLASNRRHYHINDKLEQRAIIKIGLEKCTENNVVAIFEDGMDCDCVKYSRTYHKKSFSVMEYIRFKNETYEWADGPVSVGYGKPSKHPIENYSRDLATEAYENGHPHVVYI